MSNKPKRAPLSPGLAPSERRRFRERLLGWYEREKRDLPWRGERDPYRIWVSEAMLQQTRAETVRSRYPAFIARFPTLAALADAPLDSVLAEWQGLGYYSRARNLHRTAREVARRGAGALPETRDALLGLPGVGPYMAGAIASIAFGERCAAVDANVLRVMSRILRMAIPVASPRAQRIVRAEAQALVPRSRPGDFNQALMELGAQVCLPRAPDCAGCPVRGLCAGFRAGAQDALPVRTPKKPPAPVTLVQFWAERGGLLLLVRRKRSGLWGGMWELPGFMEEGHRLCVEPGRLRAGCAEALGCGWRPGQELARVQRTLTHRKVMFVVYQAESPDEAAPRTNGAGRVWASEEEVGALAVSSAQRAAWRAAKEALRALGEAPGGG